MNSTCKVTQAGYVPTTSNGDSPATVSAYNAYTANITKITQAYSKLVLLAAAGQAGSLTTADVQAARKADFTAATRNYFQAACGQSTTSGATYYSTVTTGGVIQDPGAAAVAGDPLSPYSSYTNPATTVTSGSGFNPALITAANVQTWKTQMTSTFKTTPGTTYPGLTNAQIAALIGPGTVTATPVVYNTA